VVGVTFVFEGAVDMNESTESRVPWILWPFYAIWKLLTLILNITGRIICALLGIAMMVAGVAISMSLIGAIIGIPLASFGFLLAIRALF
jgi:hypothetical protein